ncbi:MAG: GNAT family N-acetyltransferase [Candidatus Dormibacteria bacterium]|jgi:ribosomal protein S18 acetylase RimI-like enzyme
MRLTIRGRKQTAAVRQADPYRLGADLRVPLAALLDQDRVANVFLKSELRLGASLDGWWGLGSNGQLRAVLMTGSVVVPWIPDPRDIPAFAGVLRQHLPRLIIGPAPAVRDLTAAIAPWLRAVEVRDPQPVMVLDGSIPSRSVPIRRGRRDDLDRLTVAAAAMHREEMGIDPLAFDPVGWRHRMATLIDRGWSYLLIEDGEIAFKVELSAWTPEVVQLQGVWTRPELRRRGVATAALAAVCAELLAEVPVCSLYLNSYNEAAMRLYRRIGFRQVGEFATVIF